MFSVLRYIILILASTGSFAQSLIPEDIDLDSPLVIEGKVRLLEWDGHSNLMLVLANENTGFQRVWLVVIDSPDILTRRGITNEFLESLDDISIVLFPSLINECEKTCLAYGSQLTSRAGEIFILNESLALVAPELKN